MRLLKILTALFVPFPDITGQEFKSMFNFKMWGKANLHRLSVYEQNRLFFTSGASKINYVAMLVWLLIGVALVTSGLIFAIVLGVLLVVSVLSLLVMRIMSIPKITRLDVENNIQIIVGGIEQEGLNANGIDASQVNIAGDPLCLMQYIDEDIADRHYVKDKMSSNISVTYFYVGIDQFFIYKVRCSLICEFEKVCESYDYFYRVIMSSNIRTDASRPNCYMLELVFLNSRTVSFEFSGGPEVQQTLFAIKNLIRDKRNTI